MKLFVVFSAILCVVAAQQGYPRGGPQQGYSSGGPNGDRFSSSNSQNDQGFNGYPDRADDQAGEEEVGSIPGRPGEDYPIYDTVPETAFKCEEQEFPGYYADPEAQCQVFHICQTGGQMDSFLCPNGTLFNQKYLVCDWYFNVDCTQAESLWRETNEAVVNAMKEADERIARERASQQGGYDSNAQSIGGAQNDYVSNGGYQYSNGNSNNRNGQSNNRNGQQQSTNGNRNNGASTPSRTYGTPSTSFSAPSAGARTPSSTYGAPSTSGRNGNGNGRTNGRGATSSIRTGSGFASATASYSSNGRNGAAPAAPSQQYGAPSRNGNTRNGSSRNGNNRNGNGYSNGTPSTQYGVPNGNDRFGSAPSAQYGPPDRASNALGAPLTQYDPPSGSGDSFGSAPSTQYGAPNGGYSDDFSAPSSQYGPPRGNSLDRSYLPPSK